MIMDDERIYEIKSKVDRHEEDIKEVKAEVKALTEKTSLLTELSMSIKTLAENLKDVKDTVTDIKKDQNSIKDEVTELRNFPTKRKSEILDKVILAIVSALGGGILAYLLKVMFPTIFQ